MPTNTSLSLSDQRRFWLKQLLRAYIPHACIGTPLVLAGSAYIAFYLHFGAGFMWLGGLAAVMAPLPMALAEMDPYPTQQRLEKLNELQAAYAELKKQDQADGPVETDK